MELLTRPQGMSFPLVPALSGGVAAGFALIVATLPAPLLEGLVIASGLPAFLPMAEPPLGLTARALLFFGIAVGLTLLLALALWPVLGDRRVRVRSRKRRPLGFDRLSQPFSDAHPDAPAPRPISAIAELGVPFLDVTAPDPDPVIAVAPVRSPMSAAARIDIQTLMSQLEGNVSRGARRPVVSQNEAAHVRAILDALRPLPRAS